MSWNLRDVKSMTGKYKPTSEQIWFLIGFISGAATHEPITLMVGL
jgi:hypothetical protein